MTTSAMVYLADELNLTAEDLAPAVYETHRSNAFYINHAGPGRQLMVLWHQHGSGATQIVHVAATASHKRLDPTPWCLDTDDSQAAAEVRKLWDAITTELTHSDGRWPSHAVSERLAEWFAQHGFSDEPAGGESE